MCTSWLVAVICVFHVVSALPVIGQPFQCFADVCNVNGQQEFCDKAEYFRRCRRCSDVRQDCFTSQQEANCSEYCYEYRHQQDVEIQRVKGCSQPSPPENGRFNKNETNLPYNVTLEIACVKGFRLIDNPAVRCGNFSVLEWSPPRCEVITCKPLRPTPHGKWIIPVSQLLSGTNAWLECQTGYHVDGDTNVTCTSSGEWESRDKYLRVCLPDITTSGDRTALVIVVVVLVLSVCGIFALACQIVRLKRNNTRGNRRTPGNHTAADPAEEHQLMPHVGKPILEENTKNVKTADANNSATSGNKDSPRQLPIQETENPQTTTKCVENAF